MTHAPLDQPGTVPASSRPRLLVVSHVLPFPGHAGQQQRVAQTLRAARSRFTVDFLTYCRAQEQESTRRRLAEFCDRPLVMESALGRSPGRRLLRNGISELVALWTGLKRSNIEIGRLELTAQRLRSLVQPRDYDCVLYEYIHAANSASMFREQGVPVVLDTHNVLWHAYQTHLDQKPRLPAWLKHRWVTQYQRVEERAWLQFNRVIAINRSEEAYIRQRVPATTSVSYVPMGLDLALWPYGWRPARPVRIAFYGGLGSRVNQVAAQRCLQGILPAVWRQFPEVEFWLIGSNPPASLKALAGPRVKITGFVEQIQEVLGSVSLLLCPWPSPYGFRSRLIEAMALGVPVLATPEAVAGMELESGRGIMLESDDTDLARRAQELLGDTERLESLSRLARAEVEKRYSFENTYGRLTRELVDWLAAQKALCA